MTQTIRKVFATFALAGALAAASTVADAKLQSGDNGAKVEVLQRLLKDWGFYKGAVDGKVRAQTKAAVIAFQKMRKIDADGGAGKKTWAALKD